MGFIYKILHHHTERKLIYLFWSLVILLAAYPFFETGVFQSPVMVVFLTVTLSAAMYAIRYSNMLFYTGLALGLPAVVFSWLNVYIGPTDITIIGSHLFTIALCLFASYEIVKHIFAAHKVEKDAVFGAVSVYLILGIIWAVLFSLINYFDPNAFIDLVSGKTGTLMWSDHIYMSYSSLTTLGIGDIMPLNPIAKSMVALESVIGVMYIAVLVSKFIGYSEQRHRS